MKKAQRMPAIGEAFDSDQMNDPERIESYIRELEYYKPRGFSRLAKEGRAIVRTMWADAETDRMNAWDFGHDWKLEVEALLTNWARRVERHEFISFGPFPYSGSTGFWIDVGEARNDADIVLDAGDSVPRGFSGLAVFVNDHGNVHAQRFSRGRMVRNLFDVV